jgi:hypothetical protein
VVQGRRKKFRAVARENNPTYAKPGMPSCFPFLDGY